jgi:hypothetical protein
MEARAIVLEDGEQLSEDEKRCSSPIKHCPWSPLGEEHSLAYRKGGKPWNWIFG